ncbi:hypothetical protein, partial [Vibrio sp. V37_P2S8PM304]|uniref:hypothetical protein n=1 Tax=Vibrio sp. V37_P2S8PM304 TaxID=1938688 RepID=UPI001F449C90
LELFVSTLPFKPLAHAKALKYSTNFMTKNTKAKRAAAKLKTSFKRKLARRKTCETALFSQ